MAGYDAATRRLPIYFVIDCSQSNSTDFAALAGSVNHLISELKTDPQALETVYISVLIFDDQSRFLFPLTELMEVPTLTFTLGTGSERAFGDALRLLKQGIEIEVGRPSEFFKGDWLPLVLVCLFGHPTDNWRAEARSLKETNIWGQRIAYMSALRVGFSLDESLNEFADFILPDDDPKKFFQWVSQPAILKETSSYFSAGHEQPAKGKTKFMADYDAATRRLPVYLVLDCSGSMTGAPIEAVRQGMKTLLGELKSDPQALETVYLSVITFDSSARQVVPLTELMLVKEPDFQATGTTALGAALRLLSDSIDKEVRQTTETQKGDWKPLIFLMTDGAPTDKWEDAADALKTKKPGNFIACAAGSGADEATLKRITNVVVKLNDLQPDALKQFFQWVSASVATTSTGVANRGEAPINLPPPPPEIVIVP